MKEKIILIELSLLKEISIIKDVGEFDKIATAKLQLEEPLEVNEDFDSLLNEFIPSAYKDLLKANKKDYTHVGFLYKTESGKIISTSYNLDLLEQMEKYSDEDISGIAEAAIMTVN
jgi:hypothetical protein